MNELERPLEYHHALQKVPDITRYLRYVPDIAIEVSVKELHFGFFLSAEGGFRLRRDGIMVDALYYENPNVQCPVRLS